ncbi:hypothetical protein CDAR_244811 [Caerostris darwini]|uniref:Uncharacterized protein n=1 Tax=Caerostris darwini TaxID=1538125 RepID=A0AAV4U930_9ARAC|nr:hypothetical protein CDAR_244811 [Caerostris darwini]
MTPIKMGKAYRFIQIKKLLLKVTYLEENSSNFFISQRNIDAYKSQRVSNCLRASKVRKRRHGTPPRRQKLSPDALMRSPPGE